MFHSKTAMRAVLSVLALASLALATPQRAAADSSPFLGEIAPTGTGYCPMGWIPAEGQILAIGSNPALYALFGTSFGGDGVNTFGIPDLRGRVPAGVGFGPGLAPRTPGMETGAESVVLDTTQLAPHSHDVNANNLDGNFPGPGGKLLAAAPTGGTGSETIYSDQPPNQTMSASMIAPSGNNLPLPTLDPTLVVRYCVATQGTFPPRP